MKFENYCDKQWHFLNDYEVTDYFFVFCYTNGEVRTNWFGYGNYEFHYRSLFVPSEEWSDELKVHSNCNCLKEVGYP